VVLPLVSEENLAVLARTLLCYAHEHVLEHHQCYSKMNDRKLRAGGGADEEEEEDRLRSCSGLSDNEERGMRRGRGQP
jgi:hypothetical protein